jgi:hypothetical protein
LPVALTNAGEPDGNTNFRGNEPSIAGAADVVFTATVTADEVADP